METASYILIGIGGLAALVGFIVVLIVAFRVSVGWGLAVLFLSWLVIPLVVFLVKYWPEARAGFLLSVSGWVLSGVGSFLLAGSVATTTVAEFGGYQEPAESQVELARPDPARELEVAQVDPRGSFVEATATPLPPPTSTPTVSESATPEPADAGPEVIPAAEAKDHVGEMVVLVLADGSSRRVVISSVGVDGLRVTERVGGGMVTYPVKWSAVNEIHPFP